MFTVSVKVIGSHYVHGLSPRLQFPPIPQRCVHEESQSVSTAPVWMSVGVCEYPAMQGRPTPDGFLSLTLSYWGMLWLPVKPELEQMCWKSIILLVLIHFS